MPELGRCTTEKNQRLSLLLRTLPGVVLLYEF